jgi:hypothetical protein
MKGSNFVRKFTIICITLALLTPSTSLHSFWDELCSWIWKKHEPTATQNEPWNLIVGEDNLELVEDIFGTKMSVQGVTTAEALIAEEAHYKALPVIIKQCHANDWKLFLTVNAHKVSQLTNKHLEPAIDIIYGIKIVGMNQEVLPDIVGKLNNLQVLEIIKTKITQLPPNFDIPQSLVNLTLHKNRYLCKLSPQFAADSEPYEQLRHLNLSENCLNWNCCDVSSRKFVERLRKFPNMITANLSGNNLTQKNRVALPKTIGNTRQTMYGVYEKADSLIRHRTSNRDEQD